MRYIRHLAPNFVALLIVSLLPALAQAEEQDPRELITRMSETIAELESFRIDSDAYQDAGLPLGQIIEHSMQVTARIRRPATMRITMHSTQDTKEIYFSEGVLTLFDHDRNFYGQEDIPPNLDAAIDYAIDEFGIDAPLMDFLSTDAAIVLLEGAERVDYFGTGLVRNQVHHHIGIRQEDIDLQVWISTEGPMLPGKISMSSKWVSGSPRFVAFLTWDTDPDIPSGVLRFEPPDGATRIKILRDPVE
jgi:hypothetical protein